jgi:N6-adenosine-specific RNA methylase IME4
MTEFHPLAAMFPLLDGAAFDELVKDIRARGLVEPIWRYEGMVLDGRNRYRACAVAGVEPRYRDWHGDDPIAFVISLNLKRRHLDESQRAMVAVKIATMRQGERTDLQPSAKLPKVSQAEAGSLVNVSERSIRSAVQVRETGVPELVAAVEQGRLAVSAAAAVAKEPVEHQRHVVEMVAAGMRPMEAMRRARIDRQLKLVTPAGKFRTIVCDPPWPLEMMERTDYPNQSGLTYPTLSLDDIKSYAIPAADNAHLFLWTTSKFLRAAFEVVEAWGFRYLATMTWHKAGGFQPPRLPQFNAEFILVARKGDIEFVDTKNFFTCFAAPRREHSRKPDEFYDVVRRVSPGPRIDMFSREARDGFVQHGNEIDFFEKTEHSIREPMK